MAGLTAAPVPSRGGVRDLLTNLACALLAVVLLRWFCLEADRIPSPSMQPALLGSAEAGVYDHVLVDKLRYLVAEPARWELAAFQAPLQQRDPFVKRLIGLPGERIAIAGGNLYVVDGESGAERWRVLRRPARVQATHWYELHPARAQVRGETPGLGRSLRGEPASAWQPQAEGAVASLQPEEPARLTWLDADGGLVDRVWDGPPLPVASALRAAHADRSHRGEIVPDARLSVRLTPTGSLARAALAIDVRRPKLPRLQFAFVADAGQAHLEIRRDGAVVAANEPMPFAWTVGATTELGFAHLDDELIAWRDGVEIARLDATAFPCRDGCELPDPCGMGPAMPSAEQRVEPSLELTGTGTIAVQDVRIWRDQHWTRGPLAPDTVLAVPPGHYLLLGDNPLQSEDGRGFAAWTLGVRDGAAVPPDTPGAARRTGNLQAAADDSLPARDDNPILLPDRHLLVVRDRFGNLETLRGDAEFTDPASLRLRWPDATPPGACELAAPPVHFVPREALLGRVMLRYWPLPPFGPWRIGWLH